MVLRRISLPICVFLCVSSLSAQQNRIARPIDATRSVVLRGHVQPRANPQNDAGPAESTLAIPGIILHLKPSAAQQQVLERLIADQQDPSSSAFHRWLSPEEYADRFAVSQTDIQKMTDWLQAEGLRVVHVGRGRSFLFLSGTAGDVGRAFHTQIRRYRVDGDLRYANSSDPSIPATLQDVVSSIEGLDDFPVEPVSHHEPLPQTTFGSGAHALAPDDLATIYDIAPLYKTGVDGTGQNLVIVGATEVDLSDIQKFRDKFNLPSQNIQTVLVPGLPDPGVDQKFLIEADLDLEWAGAVARNANIIYVYSRSAFSAVNYAIDQKLGSVISASFGRGCEQANVGSLAGFQSLAQQAVVEGITWVNAAGDTGAAGCDDPKGAGKAQDGLAVTLPASVPEITAVGGTQFNEQSGLYWKPGNDANGASAMSYIPEAAWNEVPLSGVLWSAGGGGASVFFPKPSWQTAPGVPNDGSRDVPDVALTAALQSSLPKPILPVTVTIGGVPAPIVFVGIPPSLVGVTQINFTVPPDAPLGQQDVIVKVGETPSTAAHFTVTQ